MNNLLEACRTSYDTKRSKFNMFDRMYNKLKKPSWVNQDRDRNLGQIYEDQDFLFSNGKIIYSSIVQANNNLFTDGTTDHPATVIYSLDPYYEQHLDELIELSRSLYSLKGTTGDRELELFTKAITDEMTVLFNYSLPYSITNGRTVFYTTLMVHRSHLPTRKLDSPWLPLLASPFDINTSIILPSKYWPSQMIDIWSN